jgi:hypothetical protein
LSIQHKSDYESILNAHLDRGVKSGANELIILYEHTAEDCLARTSPAFTWRVILRTHGKASLTLLTGMRAAEFRWTASGFVVSSVSPHSGNFHASHPFNTLSSLGQTLATTPGQSYTIIAAGHMMP